MKRFKPYWEYSPHSLIIYSRVLLIIAVILLCLSLLLCFVMPPMGIIFVAVSVIIFFVSRKYKKTAKDIENGTFVAPKPTTIRELMPKAVEAPKAAPVFSASISDLYEINITGVLKEHDGVNPQDIICRLREDDELTLEPDPNNPYDPTAIKVKTVNGLQIGWIPRDCNVKPLMFETWRNGGDVLANFVESYPLSAYPDKLGACIEIIFVDD